MSGWVRISRDSFDHPLFAGGEMSRREAWFWLIAKAAWKDTHHRVNGEIRPCPRGSLFVTLRELQTAWGWASDTRVRKFLKALADGLMIVCETNAGKTHITICNYSLYQDAERKENAEKTQDERKENALKEQGNKKQEDSSLRSESHLSDFQLSSEAEPKPQSPSRKQEVAVIKRDLGDAFDRFWRAYPGREGGNPKKPAKEKFDRAVKAGADPEAIIAGAEAYAAQQGRVGNIGTPYVKHATTWLNNRGWLEDYSDRRDPRAATQQPRGSPSSGRGSVFDAMRLIDAAQDHQPAGVTIDDTGREIDPPDRDGGLLSIPRFERH